MAAQLFGMISSLPSAYQSGVKQKFERGQMARTEELQKPVVDEKGQPITDYATGLRKLLQAEGMEGLKTALPGMLGMEVNKQIFSQLGGGGPSQSGGQPRTDMQRPEFLRQPPPPELGPSPAPGMVNPRMVGNQPQNLTGPIIQPPRSAGADMQAPGSPEPTQAGIPTQAPNGITTPVGNEADAKFYEDRGARRRAFAASYGASPAASKAAEKAADDDFARAKDIRDTLAKYAEPTKEQKNAPRGMSPQESAAYAEALKGQAGATAKNVAARIEGIRPAQDTVQILDEMKGAFEHGGVNISTGPGAKNWLKVKQAVNNWTDSDFFKGVPESEQIDKLNSYLAAAVAKAMTPRPTQFEFKAFQEQNPGLSTSRLGSSQLIDILRQTKQQELMLGRMADKFKFGGGKSWSEVEAEFFDKHPIISPLTHKPIDAKKAPDGKWYRPNPDQPDPSKPHYWRQES